MNFFTTGTIGSHCSYEVYSTAFSVFSISFFISYNPLKHYLLIDYGLLKASEIKTPIVFNFS